MKTIDITDISNYLFNEGIDNHIKDSQLYINRDSVVAHYPNMFPEDAYDALLLDINTTFNGRFTFWGKNDEDLHFEQIA